MDNNYLGNPNLKKANVKVEWTEEQLLEYKKCMDNPQYFIEEYVKIISLDEGLIQFKMYPFQKEMIGTFHKNRFTICKLPRQSGKSTIMISYLLHYALFNPSVNIAILANKAATARDLLGRLQLAYENLPKWLQQGVMSWNKGSLELENGSKILASSTSASAVRGGSYNIIFLDEFAYVPSNVAEQFFSSVYPTISSGKSTKVIIFSTPHGMNMFYKMWTDAEEKRNTYIPIEVHWSEVPGRDEKWKKETIANTSEQQFQTEFECEFLGSIDTLISPHKLRTLAYKTPLQSNAGLDVYEQPQKDHTYFLVADVSRGTKNDYSAYVVFDVTQVPYHIVAKYRDNEIKPLLFPQKIHHVARAYNSAHQMLLAVEIKRLSRGINVKMIIVDSLTSHFRAEFVGRGMLANRQQKLNRHLKDLKQLADVNNALVLVTNQVMSKPDAMWGDPTKPIGGHVLAHASTFRLYLRKAKGGRRIARLVDSPNLPDGECVYQVCEDGLRD